MNSGIRVLNRSMDTIPLDSMMTVEDTESETDVIELDSSCDTEVVCLDGNPIYDSKNNENSSDRDDVDAKIDVTTHSSRDLQSVSLNDGAPQPLFKVMFRDESVSRYEKVLYTLYFVYTTCAREFVSSGLSRIRYMKAIVF